MDLKTVFIVFVTTSRMIFPGIPATFSVGGAKPPIDAPATKSVMLEVHSAAKAGAQSKAEVAVPSGLKTGSPLKLTIDRSTATALDAKAAEDSKFVIKTYWGSSEMVPDGQPKTAMSTDPPVGTSTEQLPDGTLAYWPGPAEKRLESSDSAQGVFQLTSDFAGSTSVTIGKEQDFLPAVDLVGAHKKANLEKPLKLVWKAVPGALAYLVTATGGGSLQTINWTSSADPNAYLGLDNRAIERSELAKLVESKVLLPSFATSCAVPEGIFKTTKSVFVTVTAFGADRIEQKDGVETRVIVRSQVSVPIHGTTYKPMVEDEP